MRPHPLGVMSVGTDLLFNLVVHTGPHLHTMAEAVDARLALITVAPLVAAVVLFLPDVALVLLTNLMTVTDLTALIELIELIELRM